MATTLEAPGCGWAAMTARPVRLQLPAATEMMAATLMPRLQLVSSVALHAEHPCWHYYFRGVSLSQSMRKALTSQAQHCCSHDFRYSYNISSLPQSRSWRAAAVSHVLPYSQPTAMQLPRHRL